jgi:hypothetical protein
VTEVAIQRPSDVFIQLFDWRFGLLGDVTHNRVDRFALVITILALDDIFSRYSSLRKIDITWR